MSGSEIFPEGDLTPDSYREFVPNPAYNHVNLSGIEITQNVLTATTPLEDIAYQTFHLPSDYRRGLEIPAITGIQICCDTTEGEFLANITLDVSQFGTWSNLISGSVAQAIGDEQEWIEIYF